MRDFFFFSSQGFRMDAHFATLSKKRQSNVASKERAWRTTTIQRTSPGCRFSFPSCCRRRKSAKRRFRLRQANHVFFSFPRSRFGVVWEEKVAGFAFYFWFRACFAMGCPCHHVDRAMEGDRRHKWVGVNFLGRLVPSISFRFQHKTYCRTGNPRHDEPLRDVCQQKQKLLPTASRGQGHPCGMKKEEHDKKICMK